MSEKTLFEAGSSEEELAELGEKSLSSEQVYDGSMLKVFRDSVALPDGGTSSREYIKHPGAVAIVAIDEDGSILLERQFRFPFDGVFTEIPAGKLDYYGEDRLEAARRELREETGYVASDWLCLGDFLPAIAYSNERITLYLARGLKKEERELDADEFIDVFRVPFSEALEAATSGKIPDAKTQAGILRAAFVLGKAGV